MLGQNLQGYLFWSTSVVLCFLVCLFVGLRKEYRVLCILCKHSSFNYTQIHFGITSDICLNESPAKFLHFEHSRTRQGDD